MSKTRIPSPARSHGAITPRRHRPYFKKSRSVASPSIRNTARLTNIMKDAFQLSPLPQRRSVLNDDTDIQEPLRKSWWKNLNENSRDMQELYENMNPPVANNILDDIDVEPSSPEKEFSIELPDSSDGESCKSIATPQRKKIFSNKESTKQNYFKNMTIVQKKRKFSSQQSSDSDDSINVEPKKIFNYTKDKAIPNLPQELLKNLKKDCGNTSASMEVPPKKHNLFSKEPKTRPKLSDMGLNVIESELDLEMQDLTPKAVFTFKRKSSVKQPIRSSIQSVVDEDWSNPLPSSTMIGSMSDEERTPKQKRLNEESIEIQQCQNNSMDEENSMDNTLIGGDHNDVENQDLNKSQSLLKNTLADHNETLVNQSINKENKSQIRNTSVNHNQTLKNKSISKKTNKSLNHSQNNQGHVQNDENRISMAKNIETGKELSEKENSNKWLKCNSRISDLQSNSSVNNSGWDSHRTTRKTLRQTFGRDFTPRKSLRTLVMEKTAKRHTVGNFKSQGTSKQTNISNIYQTNNTHNKTVPGRHPDYNETPGTHDINKSKDAEEVPSINEENDDEQHKFVEINNGDDVQKQTEVKELEYKENGKEHLTKSNSKDVADNQIGNKEEENNRHTSNNFEADNQTQEEDGEGIVDCINNVNNSNDEENNEVGNEDDEHREMEVTDSSSEGDEQEEILESMSEIPNQSTDQEQPTETENEDEEEQEESMESTNDAHQSSCQDQVADTSNDEENQTEYDQEEIIETENVEVEHQSEDEQEDNSQSDMEQHQSSQEQLESNDDSENQSDNLEEACNNEMIHDENQESYTEETHNPLNDNEEISQLPQANSTEYPVFESTKTQAKEIPKKTINKQNLQEILKKIRAENAQRQKKLDAEVSDWRKNLKPQFSNTFFKVPQKPAIKRPQPKENKTKKVKPADKMFLNVLPPEFFEDIKYKPPKRYQPRNAAWANKHLYTFLEQKLEPKYDYKARVRAEKLVEMIYRFTQDIRRLEVAPEPAVSALKHEMARLKIIDTHFDFYEFIIDFLPQDIRHKVVPSSVNLIPLPRPSVYSSIMT